MQNALKLCNAALEKFPSSVVIKSLKSIALIRTSKPEEARAIVDELLASPSSLLLDPNAVHALMITMRDLRMDKQVTGLFETAHINQPGDLDILNQLFFCYVKEGSSCYAKQQQTAIKMNKLDPCSRYAWWIVLSVVLQAREGLKGAIIEGVQLEPKKLMQLAESLVTRQAEKDKRLDGFEALLVLLDILLAQGKDKDALDLITSSRGDVVSMAAERAHLHAILLMRNGDLASASDIFESQLKNQDPDDWITLGLCLDCIMGGGGIKQDTSAHWPPSSLLWLSGGLAQLPLTPSANSILPQIDQAVGHQRALATVNELIAMVKENRVPSKQEGNKQLTMRGPFLALVEVARRAAAVGLVSELQVASAALEFLIEQGGSLVSCAVDLRGCCTSTLGHEASNWLVNAIMSNEQLSPPNGPPPLTGSKEKDLRECRLMVCSSQVVEDLGGPLFATKEDALAYSKKLMRTYAWSEPLYMGLDSRERGPADELPVLAANAIIAAAVSLCESEGESLELLMQALLLLESCVGLRPHSAQIRLSLAALHTLVGCPEAARSHGQALDIKNIQLDSLASHHMLPALLSFYSPPTGTAALNSSSSSLTSLLRETLYLFSDHLKEASSTLRDAYQEGSYSKVLEFIAFRERIELSHTRALARAEKQILEMKERFFSDMSLRDPSADILMRSSMPTLLPLTETPMIDGPNRVRFNEDLSTRQMWYPPFSSAACLAPYFWWEKRREGDVMSSKGQGRVWWSQPFVSDNPYSPDGGPVHSYRSSKVAAVRQRWLLPHLLSSAYAGDVDKLQALLSMLPPVPAMDGDVKTLNLSIFSALASSLNAPSEQETLKFVEAIKARIDSLSDRTIVALDLDTEILPGWVVNLASVLITEVFFSLCICSRALSSSKGEVVNVWKDTVSHGAKSCTTLSAALITRSNQSIKSGSSKIVKDFTLFTSEASLPSFDAAAMVTRVAEEQRKSAAGLGEAASRLSKELSKVFY
jgi:N-terminal acetyltransferase B complex non-catalytic subunit